MTRSGLTRRRWTAPFAFAARRRLDAEGVGLIFGLRNSARRLSWPQRRFRSTSCPPDAVRRTCRSPPLAFHCGSRSSRSARRESADRRKPKETRWPCLSTRPRCRRSGWSKRRCASRSALPVSERLSAVFAAQIARRFRPTSATCCWCCQRPASTPPGHAAAGASAKSARDRPDRRRGPRWRTPSSPPGPGWPSATRSSGPSSTTAPEPLRRRPRPRRPRPDRRRAGIRRRARHGTIAYATSGPSDEAVAAQLELTAAPGRGNVAATPPKRPS